MNCFTKQTVEMTEFNTTTQKFSYLEHNSTSNYVDIDVFPTALHWFLNAVSVLITVIGVIGNLMVCYFFARRKVRRIAFNILLLNLSIADLCADIIAYVGIFVDLKILRGFSAGTADIMCSFIIGHTAFAVVTVVSIFTLTYIALNRYVFIKLPFKTKLLKSKRTSVCCIICFWVFGIAFVTPNLLSFEYEAKYAVCHRVGSRHFNEIPWVVVGVILGFVIPLCTMIIAFVATLRQFNKRALSSSVDQASLQRKRGAVVLLGFLILAFLLCLGPCLIYLALSMSFQSIWPAGIEGDYFRMRIIRIVFLLALTNTIADPFIYAYKNPEFNKCFKAAFEVLKVCKRKDTNVVLPEIAVI